MRSPSPAARALALSAAMAACVAQAQPAELRLDEAVRNRAAESTANPAGRGQHAGRGRKERTGAVGVAAAESHRPRLRDPRPRQRVLGGNPWPPRPRPGPATLLRIREAPAPANSVVGIGTFNRFVFGASGSQVVWDFAALERFRATNRTLQAQRAQQRATQLQVVLAVRTAYFSARAQRDLIAVAQENLKNTLQHQRQIQGFVEAGTNPRLISRKR